MIISILQLIHRRRLSDERWISNVSNNFGVFVGTMIMVRPVLIRTSHNCWMFKRILRFKYRLVVWCWFVYSVGSMIRIFNDICISVVCRLIYQVETWELSSKPSLSTFFRNLALKLHASGVVYSWSFFRKWILSKFISSRSYV